MDKAYEAKRSEDAIYQMWETSGYFTPKIDPKKKPFSILLPLPNANDAMHMGHALFTVQDILVRYHRMKGDPTLWLPGGDHAGIETQFVFEKKLAKEGKSRFDFDRDTLYQMIAEYVEKNKSVNRDQMKRLGFSLDWTRYHYSLEPKIVDTVLDTFRSLLSDNLAYRDARLVHYCVRCGTSFSDLETVDKEMDGFLYHIKFPIKDGGFITIATTRPETFVGDVAVMVNPKDKRYKALIGKTVVLPLTNREVPIIADAYVDMKFGTGAVKVTPAHDFNDYEIAKKHNLTFPPIIGFNGRMQNTGGIVDGLKVAAAREEIIKQVTELGLLEKTTPHHMVVKSCYRCGSTLEPLPLPQWYVKTKELAGPAMKAVKEGKTKIFPLKRFEKLYFDWMEKILDWNISRQIVWGPRIPVWYCLDCNPSITLSFVNASGEKISGSWEGLKEKYSFEEIHKGLQTLMAPLGSTYQLASGSCSACSGDHTSQETDTFDTWFLSGQWPITTLGFPDNEDFKYFYPTTVLDTLWDILFFWVARMMMLGIYRTGNVPFEVVHLHSRVVDNKGQKMSKSKGNVINPIVMIDTYGADALRMALIFGAAPGSDIVISEDKVRGMRNFANKLWNIGRFIEMNKHGNPSPITSNQEREMPEPFDAEALSKEISALEKSVTKHIERYRFSDAAQELYEYAWHQFADIHIEKAKGLLKSGDEKTLEAVTKAYTALLTLLHPFMPFVTEEIWGQLKLGEKPLIISKWPAS